MLWVKALHVIFMVTWFAGLLYLPRLFVYHAGCEDAPGRARFEVMERRLFGIMSVGALATIGLGAWLALHLSAAAFAAAGWLHVKLALVAVLVAFHLYCARVMRDFRRGGNPHGPVFFKFFNELPAVILIGIVILAVVRPM